MKKIITLSLLLLTIVTTYSQDKNFYRLNKDLEIISITFERSLKDGVYEKETVKHLIKLEFHIGYENLCYLTRTYNTDPDDWNYIRNKPKEQIDISIFYDFVRKLNEIDSDKINLNYNIIHGREYSINFYGEKYSINLSSNDRKNPETITYFSLFDSVWDLYGKE
jgi:hypothetical protein